MEQLGNRYMLTLSKFLFLQKMKITSRFEVSTPWPKRTIVAQVEPRKNCLMNYKLSCEPPNVEEAPDGSVNTMSSSSSASGLRNRSIAKYIIRHKLP